MLADHVEKLWGGLTRELTAESIEKLCFDSKVKNSDGSLCYYVPAKYIDQAKSLFKDTSVEVLEFVPGKQPAKHGLLSLEWRNGEPLPYPVPGGRFNEMYGWDSYFIVLGLLASKGDFVALAAETLRHQCFEIEQYGQVLNANRTYFLNRSQPPFLTDMAIQIHKHNQDDQLLRSAITIAIKEYDTVWACEPRLDPATGLSRFSPPATHQIPIEVEPGHFDHVIEPFAQKQGLSIKDFTEKYHSGELKAPELDEFLRHDLGVRESGHDTSARLNGKCADLATHDLNCLLYKYETDISDVLKRFPDMGDYNIWDNRAMKRKEAINTYLWNNEDGVFYDYNTKSQQQAKILNGSCFYALWAGVASPEQAKRLLEALEYLEQPGGIVCTKKAEGNGGQWDWPAGWAPHQIMTWGGMMRYGFSADARRLAKKWSDMVTKVYNEQQLIYEKYNVVDASHDVPAEYGNQGTFSEGFGWTNASIVLAANLLK